MTGRLFALIRKEFQQIRRDRRLAISLIVPPTLQLLLFGFALDSTVSNLRLGVIDYSHTPESRELIYSFTESKSFAAGGVYDSVRALEKAVSESRLDAGLVVPYDFARRIERGEKVDLQVILNAANANTATIGQGYASALLAQYNQGLGRRATGGGVRAVTAFLFNPGLVNAWFIVTGTFGVLLILNGSLVASTALIKEREAGTVEQLLMTPASTTRHCDCEDRADFLAAAGDGGGGDCGDAGGVSYSGAREPGAGGWRGGVVFARGDWHWDVYRDVFAVGAAVAADGVFCESAAGGAVGSVDAGGGDAGVAAAGDVARSNPAFRDYYAGGAFEGEWF